MVARSWGGAVTIPLTLTTGTGNLTGDSAATASGVATYSLNVDQTGTNDELTAKLALNPSSNPAPAISIASTSFDVGAPVTNGTYSLAATAVTVSPGASGTSTVTVSSTNGYAGTVTLSCAVTSSPAGATDTPTCSVSQTVTLGTNTQSGTTTVTVSTTAGSMSPLARLNTGQGKPWTTAGVATLMALLSLMGIGVRRRKLQFVLGLALVTVVLGFAACGGGAGGGGGASGGTNPGTPPGAYTITLTGTGNDSASKTASTTFTLTVS